MPLAHVNGRHDGEFVVVEPFIGCGPCYACRASKPNCCANLEIIGIHHPGGFAEYVVALAANNHKMPADLSPTWASISASSWARAHTGACGRASQRSPACSISYSVSHFTVLSHRQELHNFGVNEWGFADTAQTHAGQLLQKQPRPGTLGDVIGVSPAL